MKFIRGIMNFPAESSHHIDCYKIQRDAFTLLNLGYGFDRLKSDDEGDIKSRSDSAIFIKYGEMYSREASMLLTSISIASRMFDDYLKSTERGFQASDWDAEDFIADDTDGELLSLRECFNKVIHTEIISHELYGLPEVYLSGKRQNGKEWHIRLAILPFCVAVFDWIEKNKAL